MAHGCQSVVADVSTYDKKSAVRKVRKEKYRINQGISDCDKSINRTQRKPVDHLLK
jgi:hypothetical protein